MTCPPQASVIFVNVMVCKYTISRELHDYLPECMAHGSIVVCVLHGQFYTPRATATHIIVLHTSLDHKYFPSEWPFTSQTATGFLIKSFVEYN